MKEPEAKTALDWILRKSRVHFYKPIQIAEILHRNRLSQLPNLLDLESYRNPSKRWRDEVSRRLVGRVSTSSQKFQDNLFEANAVPPEAIDALCSANRRTGGAVEAYIYQALKKRLESVRKAQQYVAQATVETFSLREFVSLFRETPGLKRSVDKMYEIAVFALFSTITRALNTRVSVEVANPDKDILRDFSRFLQLVLGLKPGETKLQMSAALYRAGVANAADRGIDMWTNFGPAVQVKHLSLKPETVEDIAEDIRADRLVIVCLDAEEREIEALLAQLGWGARIQGVVTLNDLEEWYRLCLGPRYRDILGETLLSDLTREFADEFPSGQEIDPFMRDRGYDLIKMPSGWA